jgi:desulfoferrodoxin (superoxide reductase-like protein)
VWQVGVLGHHHIRRVELVAERDKVVRNDFQAIPGQEDVAVICSLIMI